VKTKNTKFIKAIGLKVFDLNGVGSNQLKNNNITIAQNIDKTPANLSGIARKIA
jgi:hypothetical protein